MVHPAYSFCCVGIHAMHAAHCIADELLDNGIIVPYNMLFCIICFLFYHYYIISLSSSSTIKLMLMLFCQLFDLVDFTNQLFCCRQIELVFAGKNRFVVFW